MNPVNQITSNATCFDVSLTKDKNAFRFLPDELIQKIAHMADESKLNFQLTCKKFFLCCNNTIHRATWKLEREKSFSYFSVKNYPNLREIVVQITEGSTSLNPIENTHQIKNIRKIDFGKSAWSDTLIHSLLSNSKLQYLALDSCRSISTAALRNVMIFFEQLVVLELFWANFSGMEDVTFKNLSNLEILKLDHAVSLSDQVLGNILAATPKLRELSLLLFQPNSTLAFEHMASTKITTLNLGNDTRDISSDLTSDVTLFSIREVNLAFFRKLFEKNLNLTALSLHRTIIKRDMPELEPCPLYKIENLKSLEFNFCRLKNLLGLSRNELLLEKLKLNGCENVETFIKEEKINLINLKNLSVVQCRELTNRSIKRLTEKFKSLNSIKIELFSELNSGALELAHLSHVRSFHLENNNTYFKINEFVSLVTQMPLLESLFMYQINFSQGPHISKLNNFFLNLKQLTIRCSHGLTDSLLIDILSGTKNLEKLELSHNPDITDKFTFRLLKECRSLNEIKIYNCRRVNYKFEKLTKNNGFSRHSFSQLVDQTVEWYRKKEQHNNATHCSLRS